jgi:hypothetical protein
VQVRSPAIGVLIGNARRNIAFLAREMFRGG